MPAFVVGALAVVIAVAGWRADSGCTRESDYYCIRVDPGTVTKTIDGRRVAFTSLHQSLFLDSLIHSEVNLAQPGRLLYGYEKQYAQVLELVRPPGSRVDAFFIGGGGYVFPRWLLPRHTGEITVAEIDPAVTSIARRYFGLRDSPRLHLVTGDARRELGSLPATTQFDAVFGDAFNDFSVPYHLTTREFDELLGSHLRPDGVYLMNVIDGGNHDFLRGARRPVPA